MSGRANHPAFPAGHYPGLTIRDYFASQAMSQLAGNIDDYDTENDCAEFCVSVADSMLAELDGPGEVTEHAEGLTFDDAMAIAQRCRHLDGGFTLASNVHAFRDGVGAVVSELIRASSDPARNKPKTAEPEVKQPYGGEFWRRENDGEIVRISCGNRADGFVSVRYADGVDGMLTLEEFLSNYHYLPGVSSFSESEPDGKQPKAGEFWVESTPVDCRDVETLRVIGMKLNGRVCFEGKRGDFQSRPLEEFLDDYRHAPEVTSFDS